MKRIKLTQNQYTLVDDEDFKWLNQQKWHAKYNIDIKGYYAERTQYLGKINGKKKTKTIMMHREIMEHLLGRKLKSKEIVDHINHLTLKNTKNNLRVVSHRQNTQNKKERGCSKYPGVIRNKNIQKWGACIKLNDTRFYLGHFIDEKSAAKAYEMACRLYNLGDLVCKINKPASYKTSKYFTPIWILNKRKKRSKYKHVSWDENGQKWRGHIRVNGKQKYLGMFLTEEDAYKAVLKAEHIGGNNYGL